MELEEQGKAGKSNRFRILSLSKEQNMRGSLTNHQTRCSKLLEIQAKPFSFPSEKREFPRPLRGLQKSGGGGGKFTRNSVPINGRAGSLCTRHLVEVHLCDTIPSWPWKRHNVGSPGPKGLWRWLFQTFWAGATLCAGTLPAPEPRLSHSLEVRRSHQHPRRPQREKTRNLESTESEWAGHSWLVPAPRPGFTF